MKEIYIYGLRCPRMGVIRYVGKSARPESRFRSHLKEGPPSTSETPKVLWIHELKACGLAPTLEILETVRADEWEEAEIRWIAHFVAAGNPMTNSTPGGSGRRVIQPYVVYAMQRLDLPS